MKAEFLRLLATLHRHEVEFVVVGGVAAVVEGAIVNTQDLDVVYSNRQANLERVLAALQSLDCVYRDPAERVIRPTVDRLRENRMNLLRGTAGDIDVMQRIAPGWTFADVLVRSHPLEIAGMSIRVLDLASVIESKTALGRPKDLAALPVLRNTLEMRERRKPLP